MRILHAISSIDPRQGGTSEAVLQLSREAIRSGHEIEIATIDDPASEWISGIDLPIHTLGPGRTSWQYSGKFQGWLNANVTRFDAVIVHALWQFTGVAVRRACWGRKSYFVFPHGMLDPWFNQFPLKKLKKSLIWPFAERRVLRDAAAVFFTSEDERLGARKSFSPYQLNEVITPLGIKDPPEFTPAMQTAFHEKVPGLESGRYLLFLGRIHPKKGCDLLLQAWSELAEKHPEVSLVMAGPDPGSWRMELERITTNRVLWPGMLTGDAKWGALYGAAAFVLPSHQENFGIAVAEALACSTPVLISNKVNIWREIVKSGGGFADDDTAEATPALLTRYLTLTDRQRENFRLSAKTCFQNHFRLQTAAALLHEKVAGIINSPPTR